MCHHNSNTHTVLSIFSYRTLNTFSKLSVIIVINNKKQTNGTYKQYYVKMSRCCHRKTNLFFFFFFSNAEKIENVPEFERLYACNNNASEFTQLYTRYKFYPIKKLNNMQELRIWHKHLTIQFKHSYIHYQVYLSFISLKVKFFTWNFCKLSEVMLNVIF